LESPDWLAKGIARRSAERREAMAQFAEAEISQRVVVDAINSLTRGTKLDLRNFRSVLSAGLAFFLERITPFSHDK
jgi:hypothetical protein